MKNYFLALCILLLAGCTKADVESVSYQKIDSPQFYAEFAEGDTRTFVDEKVRLLWNEGDLLTIFTTTLNQKYQFDGETGDNSGTFTQISAPQFGTGNSISANYAVYPYSSSTKISNDEVITLSLPATQQYAEGSFGPNANTMVAVTAGTNDYFLPFKNVGGFLRLRLYRDGVTVKSIQLQGNNGEKIAGKATIVAKYGKNPELEMSDDTTEIITLDCGDGVELGATAAEATDFWIVVPPTTFTKGFTITITDTDGGIMTKSTSKEYIVERNVLKSMSAFEVETEQSIPNNQIWYTTSDGKMLSQYNKNAFGANVVSNACENGKGVITFDGDVISIGDFAFSSCENLKSIIIPDGVTSVGVCAFPYCSNLTAFYGKFASSDNRCLIVDGILNSFAPAGLTVYAIPNGVTSIGNFAFSGCRNLTNITIPSGVTSIGDNTFASCENLASITIPESVISIERAAFSSCI